MDRRTLITALAAVAVLPANAEAQSLGGQRWTYASISNIDFSASLPVSFTHSEDGGEEARTWTISAPDGRAFVSVHVGNVPRPDLGSAPAGARQIRGRRYGRAYYLHVWTHDLPPQDAALARRIAESVRARR